MTRVVIPSIETAASSLSHVEDSQVSHSQVSQHQQQGVEQVHQRSPSTSQKVFAELVGTFILIFLGCGSIFVDQRSNITLVGIALAWGITVMAMIYTIGHISGAHFNPAVTIAFATSGRLSWAIVPLYVVAQLLGAILASVSLRWLFNGDPVQVMLTLPSGTTSDLETVVWEIIVSFILMFVICGAADDDRGTKELSGVAVGAAIFLDVIIAGKITGASMNPARSIGPAAATGNFRKIWIYIISPVVGTVAGSTMYRFLRLPTTERLISYEKPTESTSMKMSHWVNVTYSDNSVDIP